ncbi:GNAT family N-acetyltransferase [bacterium]|nr:GNAT family N-acetyltransferase [bacterium]
MKYTDGKLKGVAYCHAPGHFDLPLCDRMFPFMDDLRTVKILMEHSKAADADEAKTNKSGRRISSNLDKSTKSRISLVKIRPGRNAGNTASKILDDSWEAEFNEACAAYEIAKFGKIITVSSLSKDPEKDSPEVRKGQFFKGVLQRVENFLPTIEANHHKLMHNQDHWHIQWFSVKAEHQGEGAGSVLLKAINTMADEKGIPCYLETKGQKNQSIYRHHGYTTTYPIAVQWNTIDKNYKPCIPGPEWEGLTDSCCMIRPATKK